MSEFTELGAADPPEPDVGDNKSDAEVLDTQLPGLFPCVLEDFTRCSESLLWKLMMSFYDKKGVESWSQGIVPFFITSNAFIGRSYAKMMQGFFRDCARPTSTIKIDPTKPFYIVELGSGSGKFCFHMINNLIEMGSELLGFPIENLVYVMTDFTQNNFKFWQSHPNLKSFFDKGNLDSAIFDATRDTTIHLTRRGVDLHSDNPICIVANYLFDTLCCDAFQVNYNSLNQTAQITEGLVSVGSTHASEPDILDPEIILRMDNKWKYVSIDPKTVYDATFGPNCSQQDTEYKQHLSRVLDWYLDYFGVPGKSGGSVLLPTGPLHAIRAISAMTTNSTLILSGDKGTNNPSHFDGLSDPHIAIHGSFSVMVNYHAIGLYCCSKGGFALHNPQEEASLKTSVFVLPSGALQGNLTEKLNIYESNHSSHILNSPTPISSFQFPFMLSSFNEYMADFGPNDFFVMQKSLKEEVDKASLKSIIAMLKLSDWDSDVFFKFKDSILSQIGNCSERLQQDLVRGVDRLWTNHYPLDPDKDMAFEIGRIYYGIFDYERANHYYLISHDIVGAHHVTYHNIGLCYNSLNDKQRALDYFNLSLGMNADYQKAISWKDKLERELYPSLATNGTDLKDIKVEVLPDDEVVDDTGYVSLSDPEN